MERRAARGRRRWLGLSVAAAALALGCPGGAPTDPAAIPLAELAAPARASGYNLLLVTVDTLRADHLGCYGRSRARTPRIDALAQTGLRFEQVTSAVPITLPSHATIFTGQDPPTHGVRHNGTFRLATERTTLAEVLLARGYATGAFVGAYVLDRRYGLAQGFEHYDDAVNAEGVVSTGGRYNERPASAVSDAALAWLERRLDADDERPFFAWLHYFDPHAPYAAPPEYRARFGGGQTYDAEIAYTDAQVGRVLDLLRRRRALKKTLVVLIADHGEGLGEHDEPTHADLIYDSTMRVPWIISNRSLFPAGRVVADRVAGTVDLFPTLLKLLGVPYDAAALDGRNVLSDATDSDRALYIESMAPLLDYGWAALHGLRRLSDKLILAPTPEYYDLAVDGGETSNGYVGSDVAARLDRRLEERMRDWPADMEVLGLEQPLDREARERLASLGYAGTGGSEPRLGVKDPKEMMGTWRRIRRAGYLSGESRHEEAVSIIEGVLAEDGTDAKAWYTASQVHERAGDAAAAEQALQRALSLSPKADGWVNLARLALARGDEPLFEGALAEAERLDPLNGGVPLGRGHRLALQGRFAEARREFERALEIDPVKTGPAAREQLRKLR